MSKVVFLDIDGPMIPATMFLYDKMASWERRFPPTTIAVVKTLCERTGAKIVFNTTHNQPIPGVDDIHIAISKAGIDGEHFHEDRHTKYPQIDRGLAVKEWLARHPEVEDWVALDDVRFTDDERLIFIDSDAGVHLGHLNMAIDQLGGKRVIMLI
jgi:hypothetical protein